MRCMTTALLAVAVGCTELCLKVHALLEETNTTLFQTNTVHDSSESRLAPVTNSYYDFLINEGSYKFWAVFQLVTVAILLYSTFAAIYYAKYTFLKEVENSDVDDIFLRRSSRLPFLGLDPATYLRIIDSVASLQLR